MAQFQLSVMLLLPSELIATDIRTGFPNLVIQERRFIDQLVNSSFAEYNSSLSAEYIRPLRYADDFLQLIEVDLYDYFNEHPKIQLISCNVNIFTETELIRLNCHSKEHKD